MADVNAERRSELLAKVRRLHIHSRRLVAEHMAGEFRSAFKGSGIEFEEVREYQPGDDVRTIDWNVTARLARPFIKRFVEERERVILIVSDLSASMDFGTGERTKRETAAEAAALISLSALSSHDRVGLILFSDRIEKVLLPRGGNKHVLRVVREVLATRGQDRATDLMAVLQQVDRIQRQPAIVFVISDFMSDANLVETRQHLTRLSRRHDVIALWITDPRERELEPAGVVHVVDPETRRTLLLDTHHPEVQREYRDAYDGWHNAVAKMLSAARVECVEIGTEIPTWEPLTSFFARRSRGSARVAAGGQR